LVETTPVENAAVPSLKVQFDEASANAPLTQKLEQILRGAGHTLVCENPDVVLCLAALDDAPASASEAASRAITVIERINTTIKGTEENSRFWVLTSSALGLENAVTSAVHGWMRTLAMEQPKRKPSILMWDSSVEAMQNIPSVLADVRFDAAREIFLRRGEILLATLETRKHSARWKFEAFERRSVSDHRRDWCAWASACKILGQYRSQKSSSFLRG